MPMQKHVGVLLIRRLLLECYSHLAENKRPNLDLVGAHSLKGTLLSFAKQLLSTETLRREQGRHVDATASMPALHGRDGIWAIAKSLFDAIAGVFAHVLACKGLDHPCLTLVELPLCPHPLTDSLRLLTGQSQCLKVTRHLNLRLMYMHLCLVRVDAARETPI